MYSLSVFIGGFMRRRQDLTAKCFLAILFAIPCINASAQKFNWVSGLGAGGVLCEAYSVTYDAAGNVYTTGYFEGTTDFDPGTGTNYMTATGFQDAFIVKVDKNGGFVWAKHFGGTNRTLGIYTVADSFGNVYVTGEYAGTTDFDPSGGVTSYSAGGSSYDMFIMKLDAAGNFKWAKAMGSMVSTDEGVSLATDASGNVYIGGIFTGTVDFNPGSGVANLTVVPANTGGAFVLKLDSSGNYVWAKQVGTGVATSNPSYSGVSFRCMAFDGSNIYVGGSFKDSIDFDPGSGTYYVESPTFYTTHNPASFVSKLDLSGNLVWVKTIAGDFGHYNTSSVTALDVDERGNVYLGGTFRDTIDLDPGAGVHTVSNPPSIPGENAYFVKLNSSGNYVFGYQTYSTFACALECILTDPMGYLYLGGVFQGSVDMDPGTGTTTLAGTGSNLNYYVQKLDTSGNFMFAFKSDGTNSTTFGQLAVDSKKNIFVTGNYNGTYDFDPGTATVSLTSAYPGAPYIMKFDQSRMSTATVTACGQYVVGAVTHTTSGTFYDTTVSSIGSDSMLTLNLTINALPSVGTITGKDSVCKGGSITLSNAVSGGTWSVANPNATISAGVVTGVTVGTDTVKYTVTDGTTGCSNEAKLVVRIVNCAAAGSQVINGTDREMQIAPNPSNGSFTISVSSPAEEDARIMVTDIMGAVQYEFIAATNEKVPLRLNMAPGVYFICAITATDRQTKKIIIE